MGDQEDGSHELRLAVVDLAGGTVVADRLIVPWHDERWTLNRGPGAIGTWHAAIDGLAWADERTVRVAWYQVASEGVHWVPDLIQVTEVPLP